jgi:hypothetical protein
MPLREYEPRAENAAQRAQRLEVRSWQLERLGVHAYFPIGAMRDAVKAWRQGRKGGGASDPPPRRLLRDTVKTQSEATVTCQPGAQLWSSDGRVLDCLQYAWRFGVPLTWRGAVARVQITEGISDARLRALFGQSVHWGTGTLVGEKLIELLGREPRSFAQIGAGMGCLGAAMFEACKQGRPSYLWYAEGNDAAAAAHAAFWEHTGQRPTRFRHAERTDEAKRADVELITLRCAPFSQANPRSKGANGAIRELRAVVDASASRGPAAVIYENAHGLWQKERLRALVEDALAGYGSGYKWVAFVTSPHLHGGGTMRRSRVIYVGVRQDD